jgi:hypothetical protein
MMLIVLQIFGCGDYIVVDYLGDSGYSLSGRINFVDNIEIEDFNIMLYWRVSSKDCKIRFNASENTHYDFDSDQRSGKVHYTLNVYEPPIDFDLQEDQSSDGRYAIGYFFVMDQRKGQHSFCPTQDSGLDHWRGGVETAFLIYAEKDFDAASTLVQSLEGIQVIHKGYTLIQNIQDCFINWGESGDEVCAGKVQTRVIQDNRVDISVGQEDLKHSDVPSHLFVER